MTYRTKLKTNIYIGILYVYVYTFIMVMWYGVRFIFTFKKEKKNTEKGMKTGVEIVLFIKIKIYSAR